MCGISGAIGWDPAETEQVIDAQLDLLEHRGPDARGHFAGSRGSIGQNRLAIIDLVTGDPPITNEDQTIAAVLNGEIYNFASLRGELARRGHEFRSDGDTEVLAHLAEELPPVELARRLDGMFGFAIWDERRETLVLGRDRVGKKPLYYWCDEGKLVFGSEIKAVLAAPAVPRQLAPRAIPAYLTFGYVPTPETFFDGVRSLPPGHVLTFRPGGEALLERYWEPPIVATEGVTRLDRSLGQAAAETRALLDAAVRRRLVSDVPLGAFLSGGVDSGAVVGLMATAMSDPVETFTVGFEDRDGFDERSYAALVAKRHGANHHEFVVHPNAVDLVERLVWHHDQPFGDSSAIPTFLLSEVTAGHVTVALSGDGGDELFAGYERFAAGLAARRWSALPDFMQAAVGAGAHLVPRKRLRTRLRRFAEEAALGLPDAYRSWTSFVAEADRDALLDGQPDNWALDDYRALWAASAGAHPLDRLLDLNMRSYLPDDLLVKVDRMSMAHGLEVRSPFLDADLIAYTTRLPPVLKARGLSLKRVLRAAVSDLLPAEILSRGKRGFGVPLDRWFREDLRSYLGSMVGAPDARVKDHLQPEAVDRLLAEHLGGRRDHGQALWTLLTLEVFLRNQGW